MKSIIEIILHDRPRKNRIIRESNGRYYVQELYFWWEYSRNASQVGYNTEDEAKQWISNNNQPVRIIEL